MTIYTTYDISSINLRHFYDKTSDTYQKLQDSLSSGNKYVSIGDNPSAITTSRVIDTQLSANSRAMNNADIGINMLSVVEDTQDQVIDSLQRIRDLCLEISNETYDSESKDAVLLEIRQRLSRFDELADSTSFNNINLFDGSQTSLKLQVGSSSASCIDIAGAFTKLYSSALGGDIRLNSSISGSNWTTVDIHNYMNKIDFALTSLTNNVAVSGAFTNRLSMITNNLSIKNENLTQTRSELMDTDVAEASTELVQKQIMQQATMSMMAQANQIPSIALSLLGS